MNTESGKISFERGISLNLISVIMNAAAMTISKFALTGINPLITTLIICITSTILSYTYMKFKRHTLSLIEFKKLIPIAIINAIACFYIKQYFIATNLTNPVNRSGIASGFVNKVLFN